MANLQEDILSPTSWGLINILGQGHLRQKRGYFPNRSGARHKQLVQTSCQCDGDRAIFIKLRELNHSNCSPLLRRPVPPRSFLTPRGRSVQTHTRRPLGFCLTILGSSRVPGPFVLTRNVLPAAELSCSLSMEEGELDWARKTLQQRQPPKRPANACRGKVNSASDLSFFLT